MSIEKGYFVSCDKCLKIGPALPSYYSISDLIQGAEMEGWQVQDDEGEVCETLCPACRLKKAQEEQRIVSEVMLRMECRNRMLEE